MNMNMSQQEKNEELDAPDDDHGQQLGPGSAGQSGDTQGLSAIADADALSVEELTESGQDYEAAVIQGVEDAADHPEKPLRPRED